MKKYIVTFTRFGFAEIEAESEEDVFDKVSEYGKEDISWSDEFEATNAQEEEE